MPDIAFDLRYLRYAILAAEYGSFRRTAEVLSVSQSTVSRRIQILERRIGIILFERHRSGARATLAGERFLKEAAAGAKHLHQAVNAVALAKRGYIGVLRIGLMASLANSFLAELLAAYHRRFPAIEMVFEEATSQINASALLNGRLDVAFMLGEPQLPGYQAEWLWDERIYVAVPASHEAASLNEVTWDDVRRETFLVMAEAIGPETEDYLVRQLSGPGFRPRISIQRVGCENLLNMVARGFGITVPTLTLGGRCGAGCAETRICRPNEPQCHRGCVRCPCGQDGCDGPDVLAVEDGGAWHVTAAAHGQGFLSSRGTLRAGITCLDWPESDLFGSYSFREGY